MLSLLLTIAVSLAAFVVLFGMLSPYIVRLADYLTYGFEIGNEVLVFVPDWLIPFALIGFVLAFLNLVVKLL